MSKVIEKINFRVVVEPKTHVYGIKLSYVEQDCKEMADQIKRHVDNVSSVSVDFDTNVTCSHCGYGWEEDITGEPLCCNAAIEEWKQLSDNQNAKK